MKKVFLKPIILILLIIPLTLSGCAGLRSANSQSVQELAPDKITVTAMNFPAYDFARQITCGRANVILLLSPGADSHSYEPTPADIIAIENSDLFLYTGGESDTWIERTLSSLGTDELATVRMMDAADILEEEIVEGMEADSKERDSDEIEYDEHVWTSPENAIKICDAIAAELFQIDPENADFYAENLRGYTEELRLLNEDFRKAAQSGARRCVVFGDRFPFRYLADELGLEYRAAFAGCSDETEPGVRTLTYLIDKVRRENIPVVFKIEFSNGKIAETIAEETGAKVLDMHSCHNVSREDFDGGETYTSLMRRNLENLKEALN